MKEDPEMRSRIMVFPGKRKGIFVHGRFWHGHGCARGARMPKTNADYWQKKIVRNRARDVANVKALKSQGWQVATVWECELKGLPQLRTRLAKFFR